MNNNPACQDLDAEAEEEDFNELVDLVVSCRAPALAVVAHVSQARKSNVICRSPSVKEQRMDWESFLSKYNSKPEYIRHMRMPAEDFDVLLSYVKPLLTLDEKQSLRRGATPIIPELKLYCCIRWLAGGSYSDVAIHVNVSITSFFRVVWETVDAINKVDALKMHFPHTPTECFSAAEAFTSLSYKSAITNCVSVIDGYNPEIKCPTRSKVGNVRAFFSGHKQKNCVNVQAAVDAYCRFQFIGVAGPGNMRDREAIKRCGLLDLVESLPGNYVAILDCAYAVKTHSVPLFFGVDKLTPWCDNFNFYGSQLRIRSEMAFTLASTAS
mmetsp:Transcript_33/g.162  ORF Transcript_33/g.162 Transcript_33/m.162 type:complete len:325 (+) Transcript_33:1459-2433(+)